MRSCPSYRGLGIHLTVGKTVGKHRLCPHVESSKPQQCGVPAVVIQYDVRMGAETFAAEER